MPPEARSSADPNSPALLDSVAPGWNRRGYLNFDPRYQPFCFNPKLWSKKARGWRWNTWNSSLPICHALRLTQFPWVMNKWSGRPLDHHLNSSFPRLLWSVPHSFPAIIHAHTNKWAVYTRSCSSEGAKGMLILKAYAQKLHARSFSLRWCFPGFCLHEVLSATFLHKINKEVLDVAQLDHHQDSSRDVLFPYIISTLICSHPFHQFSGKLKDTVGHLQVSLAKEPLLL